MLTSAKLTIFEGPDGGGKSTAAKRYAVQTGARYVHFPALPRVTSALGRLYVEAMLPALLGYQDVVLDRCWLSEVPYGLAFRGGADRLGATSVRLLERLALRCGAVVVRCLPPWEVVQASYLARRHLELLTDVAQLAQVDRHYREHVSGLPEVAYDYTRDNVSELISDDLRHARHPLVNQTAGSYDRARVVLVGEAFAERKDLDPWYQWPFASFSQGGCSQWLAAQLEAAGVPEQELLWANADQDLGFLRGMDVSLVALGAVAATALAQLGLDAALVAHPQAHKRFKNKEPYPLITLLKGASHV